MDWSAIIPLRPTCSNKRSHHYISIATIPSAEVGGLFLIESTAGEGSRPRLGEPASDSMDKLKSPPPPTPPTPRVYTPIQGFHSACSFLKKKLDTSRPSEYPPVRGENVKMFRCFFSLFFSLISLITDGPHHYHPACGHKGYSHLSPVHALQFFIAMQVQHSYNSSTNG